MTVSDEGRSPYGAVYTNDLWSRLCDSEVVVVTQLDPTSGKPSAVALVNGLSEWSGVLPPYFSKIQGKLLNATAAYVRLLLDAHDEPPFLEGTICANTLWNASLGQCRK